jgi:hypothetical protein
MKKRIISTVFFCLILTLHNPLEAHTGTGVDLHEFVRGSGFIFKGQVTNVEYKHSEAVPLLDPNGLPIVEDGNTIYVHGSNMPHTFVTCAVVQIYKGDAPPFPLPTEVTLRFEGGPDPNEDTFLLVPDVPLFDPCDRDFLFVKGNDPALCPLYNWSRGRFRILNNPNDPNSTNMIYNEYGQQIRLVADAGEDPNFIILGAVQDINDVLTHTMGSIELAIGSSDDEGEEADPNTLVWPGDHATENAFEAFIAQVVSEECGQVNPKDCGIEFVSHDPNQSFYGIELTPAEPNDLPETEPDSPRPWLDDLDANQLAVIREHERIEVELFTVTGNPVLPETPCELKIFYEGPLAGDISGPQGKPDCCVNLYDLAALCAVWLECNYP